MKCCAPRANRSRAESLLNHFLSFSSQSLLLRFSASLHTRPLSILSPQHAQLCTQSLARLAWRHGGHSDQIPAASSTSLSSRSLGIRVQLWEEGLQGPPRVSSSCIPPLSFMRTAHVHCPLPVTTSTEQRQRAKNRLQNTRTWRWRGSQTCSNTNDNSDVRESTPSYVSVTVRGTAQREQQQLM